MTPVALHHVIDGPSDAPALLLLGSLGTTLEMWTPQRARLRDRHRLILADHRGHGGSPVPPGPYTIAELGGDVVALLDHLRIDRADVCGLSIGGMVAQWLAIHAQERMRRLALVCTAPDMPHGDAFRQRAATVRSSGSTEAIADAVLANWFTPAWAARHPGTVAQQRAVLAGIDPEGYAGCCEAIADHDVTARLPEVEASTLVIAAAEDRAIDAEQSRRIAALIPDARLQVLSPAAHIATIERGDQVNQLLQEHLA